MKKISFNKIKFTPASHEDKLNPGSLKKILFTFADLTKNTKLQMINWSKLPPQRSFKAHYHEDMDEIFIILDGTVTITIDRQKEKLEKGDAVFIPMGLTHQLKNLMNNEVNYLAIGLSLAQGGRTIVTDK